MQSNYACSRMEGQNPPFSRIFRIWMVFLTRRARRGLRVNDIFRGYREGRGGRKMRG